MTDLHPDIVSKRNACAVWAEVVRSRAKRYNLYNHSDAAQLKQDAVKLADLTDELIEMTRPLLVAALAKDAP